MAVTWGSYAYGTHNFRLGYEFVVTADSSTSQTVRLDIWFYGDWGVNDTSNSFGVSGSWSAGGAVSVVASYNTAVKIWSQSQTFSKVYGATQSKSFSSSLSGLDVYGTGTTASVGGTHTVSARPYDLPTAPGAPVISLLSGTGARADWADPASWGGNDTSSFDLQISDDPGMASPTTIPQGDNDHTFTGLTPGAQKYTWVYAKNAAGNGPPSAITSFTLLDYPSAPQNPVVSGLKSNKATLAVTAPADNGGAAITAYRFQVSTDPGFGTTAYNIQAGTLTRDVTGLDPSTDYYWQAQAVNSVGAGAWVSGTFTTKSAAVIQKAGVVKQISAIYIQKAGVPKLVTKVGVKSTSWRY